MSNIISEIYGFLAKLLVFTASLPGNLKSQGQVSLFVIAAILGCLSLLLIFFAVKTNNGSYQLYVKLGVSSLFILLIAEYAILDFSGLNILKSCPLLGSAAAGLFFVGVIAFIIVNFKLDSSLGKTTLFLCGAGFLFVASVLRLWYVISANGKAAAPEYEKIMLLSAMLKPVLSKLAELGFSSLIGVIEYILLIVVMFITVLYIFKTRTLLEEEWLGAFISQIMIAVSYLIFEVHKGIPWRVDMAFLAFLLFCTGGFLYIFIFCYVLDLREQDKCIGAFFMGVSGVLLDFAVILSVDMSRRGSWGTMLNRLSGAMTTIYRAIPIGRYVDFTKGSIYMHILGGLVTLILTVLLVLLVFLLFGRAFNYEEEGAGMGVIWFRNCAMLLVIPIIVYWICSLYGNLFGESYKWIRLLIHSVATIGSAICVSNIAPAFKNGFVGQLKLILISTLGSVAIVCLLIPVIMALL